MTAISAAGFGEDDWRLSARVGGAGVCSSSASPLHALRETSRIERRVDEERLAREKAIAALEARLASDASRSQASSQNTTRGEDDLQRRELVQSIRCLGDRLDLIESHTSRRRDSPVAETKLRFLESEMRRALDLAEAQLAEGLERRLGEVQARERLEARLEAKLVEFERGGLLQRAVAEAQDKAAKTATDLNNLNASLRREIARQSGVAQRTALEALDRQLGALRQDFARSESEQTDLHRNMRASFEALKSDLASHAPAAFRGSGCGHAARQLSPLEQAQQELTPVACAGLWSAQDGQSPSPSPTPGGEGLWTEAVQELEGKLQDENPYTPDWNSQAGSHEDASPMGFLELLTTLRQEMARLSTEVHSSLSENEASNKAALEALDARLKEEIDCIITYRDGESLKSPCVDAGGSDFQEELSELEARIRAALADQGQLAESQAADLEALDVRLRDEIQRVSTEHFEGQDNLRIEAASQRRELLEVLEEKHVQANIVQKDAMESLEAGNEVVRCLVLEFKDELQSAAVQANSDFRRVLEASESTLRGEFEDRHGQWKSSHKAALDAHAAQQALLEHLDAKSQRAIKQESAESHVANDARETLRALGLELRGELEKRQGQAKIEHEKCLEALDAKFQTEVARLTLQHQEDHDVVKGLVSECKAELHGATGQIHFNHCKAIEAVESTLRSEFEAKRAQSEVAQHEALEALQSESTLLDALEVKLRGEIDTVAARVRRDKSLADHRQALETLEVKLRGEIAEKYSLANESRKTAFETLDQKMRTEIDRIAAGIQDSDEATEGLVSEYCGSLEAKLREEIGKSDSAQQAALLRLSAGHETLRDLLAQHRQVSQGTSIQPPSTGELDAVQQEALDAAEARLRVELLQAVVAALPQQSPRGCLDAGC